MNFETILRILFFIEHLNWLLLWFILVASIILTYASWFSRHRFKLEAEDLISHILQINSPNFIMKILALCSAKSLQSFYISLFCSQLVYTCLKHGVVRILVKSFPKLIYILPLSVHKWHIIVQTNRNNKTSILTNKATLALIFSRGCILLA